MPEFWLGLCEIEMAGTTVQLIWTAPIRCENKEPKINAMWDEDWKLHSGFSKSETTSNY